MSKPTLDGLRMAHAETETNCFYHGSRSREEKAMHNGRDEDAYAPMGTLIQHASGCTGVYQGESEIFPDKFIVVCIPACFACDHPAVVARWEKRFCTPTGQYGKTEWKPNKE